MQKDDGPPPGFGQDDRFDKPFLFESEKVQDLVAALGRHLNKGRHRRLCGCQQCLSDRALLISYKGEL